MTVEMLIEYCLQKGKAYLDYPFGAEPICVKVQNKIFAEIYPQEENYKITLKCEPMLADFYRQQFPSVVVRGYHCPSMQQPYRNTVYINKTVSDDELLNMIDHSYCQVIKSFSKKVKKEIETTQEIETSHEIDNSLENNNSHEYNTSYVIETSTKIKSFGESDLVNKNIIMICKLEDGFADYEHLILSGEESAYHEFIRRSLFLNGEANAYVDFYFSRLTEEQKLKFRQSLKEEELKNLESLDLTEGIYFPLTEQLIEFFLMVTAKEILFSTFYFTKYPCTLWGNYGLKFPIFFEDNEIKRMYQNLAITCGLSLE